ncbi:MAG: hypothetical protein LT070_03260 [Solirubrobacteraceae bacterium]|nr:hypothetical protein [Solirubrobacteraceae bacterium]
MRVRPLSGPLLVLAGALALLVLSLMTWYEVRLGRLPGGERFAAQLAREAGFATSANGWEPYGLLSDALLLTVIVGGAALALTGLATGAALVAPALAALAVGAVGVVLVGLRLLDGPQPGELVSTRAPAWLALLATLAMLAGAALWWDRAQHAGDR